MYTTQIFGIGSYILPKDMLFFEEAVLYHSTKNSFLTSLSSFIAYGITEHITVDISIPYVTNYQTNHTSVSGLDKLSNRVNIDLYNYKTEDSELHVIGFDIINYPLSKTHLSPVLSDGCVEDYMGITFTYDTPTWGFYCANSYGFTNTWHNFKHGDQWGTACIGSYKPIPTLILQLELTGFIQANDLYHNQELYNSSEALFLLGPTMRFGGDHVQIVAGVVGPIYRKNRFDTLFASLGIWCFF